MKKEIKKRTAGLHNLGCKVNSYETESMQQMLEAAGYEIVDFADQPGHFTVLGPPGQDGKGVQVGIKVLVGLLNADETLNGAAVHHDLARQRPLDLGGSDGHIFELAEYVGELHPDELDVLFLDHAEDILLGVSAHEQSPFNL